MATVTLGQRMNMAARLSNKELAKFEGLPKRKRAHLIQARAAKGWEKDQR